MNKRNRRRLGALQRRRDYLTAKVRHDLPEERAGFARQELAALTWAIELIEAADLVGAIDELETVAGIDPEPEAWARRGEQVPETEQPPAKQPSDAAVCQGVANFLEQPR
jgi:hypothetical protein